MTVQRTDARTRRPPVPPRRVRLEPVARRDAAQRLSLALTLLLRAGTAAGVPAPAPPALATARPGEAAATTQEEGHG